MEKKEKRASAMSSRAATAALVYECVSRGEMAGGAFKGCRMAHFEVAVWVIQVV